MMQCPVVAVIVQRETVNRGPLIVDVVAHKDLGGDHQLYPPKHLLQMAARTMFLKRMWVFISPCMLVMSIQNPILCEETFG
jgi:hypothetical protein